MCWIGSLTSAVRNMYICICCQIPRSILRYVIILKSVLEIARNVRYNLVVGIRLPTFTRRRHRKSAIKAFSGQMGTSCASSLFLSLSSLQFYFIFLSFFAKNTNAIPNDTNCDKCDEFIYYNNIDVIFKFNII